MSEKIAPTPPKTQYLIVPPRTFISGEHYKNPARVLDVSKLSKITPETEKSSLKSSLKRSESQPSNIPAKSKKIMPTNNLLNSPITNSNIFDTPEFYNTVDSVFTSIPVSPISMFDKDHCKTTDIRSVTAYKKPLRKRIYSTDSPIKRQDNLQIMTANERRKYHQNKAVLVKVKAKIGKLLQECKSIEESAENSEKQLNRHSRSILRCLDSTEKVSSLTKRDKYFYWKITENIVLQHKKEKVAGKQQLQKKCFINCIKDKKKYLRMLMFILM